MLAPGTYRAGVSTLSLICISSTSTEWCLLKLLLDSGGQVLGHAKSLNSDINGRNLLSSNAVCAEVRDTLLDSDVVGVLAEEIRLIETQTSVYTLLAVARTLKDLP